MVGRRACIVLHLYHGHSLPAVTVMSWPVPGAFFHPPHGRGPVWNVAGLVSVGIHG